MSEENAHLNGEGYKDTTAGTACDNIVAVEKKIYYLVNNLISTARLAGFKITCDIMLKSGDGTLFNGSETKRRYEQHVKELQQMRKDS